MKKIAASLLAFILILSFCACGQSSTSENSSDIETAFSTAASVEPVTEVVQSTESEESGISEIQKKKYDRYVNKTPSAHTDNIDHNAFDATEVAFPRINTDLDEEILAKTEERVQAIRETKTDIEIGGTAYYVSSDGNDANSGLSPEAPWKTISKLNTVDFHSGDAVLFKRGDIWRGECLELKAGVTYSAYGEGDKPAIYGSPENGAGAEKWELLEGTDNIWVFYKDVLECGTIVLDESIWMSKINPYIKDGQFLIPLW